MDTLDALFLFCGPESCAERVGVLYPRPQCLLVYHIAGAVVPFSGVDPYSVPEHVTDRVDRVRSSGNFLITLAAGRAQLPLWRLLISW